MMPQESQWERDVDIDMHGSSIDIYIYMLHTKNDVINIYSFAIYLFDYIFNIIYLFTYLLM